MSSPSELLASLLPASTDADMLEYLAGTVESTLEDGDGSSVEALSEALSDLLLSYELCADEDEAHALCSKLSEQIAAQGAAPAAAASSGGAPPALLSAPMKMGIDNERVDTAALLGGATDVDAFGNKVSAVARANANWKSDSLAALEKAAKEEENDADAGGVSIGLRQSTASSLAEQARLDAKAATEAQRARERACELYLDSKAAGGSRDVAIRSMILLAPNGKALLEDGAPLRLSEGRKYGLVGRNGTGKTTLPNAISSYEITGFPSHLKVVARRSNPRLACHGCICCSCSHQRLACHANTLRRLLTPRVRSTVC